jgi:hypothetical protein
VASTLIQKYTPNILARSMTAMWECLLDLMRANLGTCRAITSGAPETELYQEVKSQRSVCEPPAPYSLPNMTEPSSSSTSSTQTTLTLPSPTLEGGCRSQRQHIPDENEDHVGLAEGSKQKCLLQSLSPVNKPKSPHVKSRKPSLSVFPPRSRSLSKAAMVSADSHL